MLAEIAAYPVKGLFAGVMYVVFILAALIGWALGKEEAIRIEVENAKRIAAENAAENAKRKRIAMLSILPSKPSPALTADMEIKVDEPKPKRTKSVKKPKPVKSSKKKPIKEPIKEPIKKPLTSKDIITDAISGLKNLGYSARQSKLIVKELAEKNKYECATDLMRDVFKHARK